MLTRAGADTLLSAAVPLQTGLGSQLQAHVGKGLKMVCAQPSLVSALPSRFAWNFSLCSESSKYISLSTLSLKVFVGCITSSCHCG